MNTKGTKISRAKNWGLQIFWWLLMIVVSLAIGWLGLTTWVVPVVILYIIATSAVYLLVSIVLGNADWIGTIVLAAGHITGWLVLSQLNFVL